jgi:hypothetical protein
MYPPHLANVFLCVRYRRLVLYFIPRIACGQAFFQLSRWFSSDLTTLVLNPYDVIGPLIMLILSNRDHVQQQQQPTQLQQLPVTKYNRRGK